MIKKEIAYNDFKIEYFTNGEVPCHYINIIDESLQKDKIDIDILINLLTSTIENYIKDLDFINENNNQIINNIKYIKKLNQSYDISRKLSKNFCNYIKLYQYYQQINSIKVFSNNNENLDEISKLIEKIDEHKELFSKSINTGINQYKELINDANNTYNSLSYNKRIQFIKILNPIISKIVKSNKKTLSESLTIINEDEDFNIITLVGDVISTIFGMFGKVFEWVLSFPKLFKNTCDTLFYSAIGTTFIAVLLIIFTDIGKSGFFAIISTILQALLSFAPVKAILVVAGIAFAIMFISMMIFLTITVIKYINNMYIDNENVENNLLLNDKLDMANKTAKEKENNRKKNNNISFNTSNISNNLTNNSSSTFNFSSNDKEENNNTSKEVSVNDLTFPTNDNNNTFAGFNNVTGFKPKIESKPNDKYGIF